MADLIDRQTLMDGYKYMGYDSTEHPEGSYMEGWCKGFNSGVEHCIHHVIHAPSVEAEPVRHGHWEIVDGWDCDEYYRCTECGAEFVRNDYLYCPHCGAKMYEVT